VVSPILEEYIRNKYPKFPIISSTCKEIRDFNALSAELNKDYKLVVLDYNYNNNYEFLEKLPKKEKCEFLVNATCIPNCQRRGEHYRTIGENGLRYGKAFANKTAVDIIPFECEYQFSSFYTFKKYATFIEPDDILDKYLPMGFSNFKIEGRNSNVLNVLESYVYYLIKPEFRDEVRLEWLTALMSKNAI
jgi:collagenase-like PrtC family protease